MDNKLTWLHISDIHFHPSTEWRDSTSRNSLIVYLKNIFKVGEAPYPDLIFCTGDIAFGETGPSPLAEQYQQAEEFFDKLLAVCGENDTPLPIGRLFVVPGNHDVNRQNMNRDLQKIFNLWATSEAKQRVKIFNDRFEKRPKEFKDMIIRLDEYGQFIKNYLPHQCDDDGRYRYAELIELNGLQIGIAGFNSAWACGDLEDDRNIWLAAQWQFNAALEPLKTADVRIGLIHHPVDWFNLADRDIATQRISTDFHFWLHGHSHNQWLIPAQSHTTIAAGAVGADHSDEFGINLVHIDLATNKGTADLFEHKSSARSWKIATVEVHAPHGQWAFDLPSTLPQNKKITTPIPAAIEQEKGSILIDAEFFANQQQKHASNVDLKQEFYGGKKSVQWYGVVQQLDAPRQVYQATKQAIIKSFNSEDAVAALVKGDGGSGKSVFLRRLAHDLCADYRIYWLEDIQSFLDSEWIDNVLKPAETPPQSLIFLEDWYHLVENSQQIKEAAELLNKISRAPHARLIIGDRFAKVASNKIYVNYVSTLNVFELSASENTTLLEHIFLQMPKWRNKTTFEQIEKSANASLFQLLFIFQYADDITGSISDIYQRIFASDCRTLLERSAFWKGMAKALYFYAHVYTNTGAVLSLVFLRDLAAYLGDCTIPNRYNVEALANNTLLKKYFGLNSIYSKSEGIFRFHHDTMADNGWALVQQQVS